MTWEVVLPLLSVDPRFRNSPLPPNTQISLFHAHVGHLRAKHMTGLYTLFEAHAPTLAATFESLPIPSLLGALPIAKLGLDARSLEHEFEKWQRERTNESRIAFDEMLAENSFIEFWGKLKKIGGEGVGLNLYLIPLIITIETRSTAALKLMSLKMKMKARAVGAKLI